ncbi:MAG TPA: hypothetical protein VE981_17890 [Planctomycetota bacterium]|nr:hypothetical protein [Planctomycetota bacterium]
MSTLLRALVIDSDPRVLANIVHVLAHTGFHVATRLGPDDSLNYVRRSRPDVVLLGLPFWEQGWGSDILAASPDTVVIPVVGSSDAPWQRDVA